MYINLYFWDIVKKSGEIEVLDLNLFRRTNPLRGFYVNSMRDHLVTSHAHIEKPHRHDFYLCILFTQGSGTHTIDFTTYDVKPGSVFVMSPGQMHHWNLSDDANGFIFCHTKPFYEMRFSDEKLSDYAFFSHVKNIGAIYLDNAKAPDFASHFIEMQKMEIEDDTSYRHFVLNHISLVYVKLQQLVRAQEHAKPTPSYLAKFHEFETLLEANFRTEKSPKKYADLLAMTPKHLNRINRQTVGKSTSEIIMERLFLEAKRLLVHSDANFAQIAFELGFEDYAYFSKLFKKKNAMTPSQFQYANL